MAPIYCTTCGQARGTNAICARCRRQRVRRGWNFGGGGALIAIILLAFVAKLLSHHRAVSAVFLTPTSPAPPSALHTAPGTVVNLLALVDTRRDTEAGNWHLDRGTLASDGNELAHIEFPYQPPEEYDFEIVFSEVSGTGGVAQVCADGGHQFLWNMGAFTNQTFGFDRINGSEPGSARNPSLVRRGLVHDRKYTSRVCVRRNSISAYFDGQLVTNDSTDGRDLSLNPTMQLRDGKAIGLGTFHSPTIFYKATLTELSGAGTQLR